MGDEGYSSRSPCAAFFCCRLSSLGIPTSESNNGSQKPVVCTRGKTGSPPMAIESGFSIAKRIVVFHSFNWWRKEWFLYMENVFKWQSCSVCSKIFTYLHSGLCALTPMLLGWWCKELLKLVTGKTLNFVVCIALLFYTWQFDIWPTCIGLCEVTSFETQCALGLGDVNYSSRPSNIWVKTNMGSTQKRLFDSIQTSISRLYQLTYLYPSFCT